MDRVDRILKNDKDRKNTRLLVITTTWWPSIATIASALEQAGFDVTVLCPRGHAAWSAKRYRCVAMDCDRPVHSMLDAIADIRPALLIPGDDRTVLHLRSVHATAGVEDRALIERSIGREASFGTLVSRVPLLKAAAGVGMAVPEGGEVRSLADLERWTRSIPAPWVLKVDGAWGGQGVRIVRTGAEARTAFADLSRGLPLWMALKRKVINGDPFWMQDRRSEGPRMVSIQTFVDGRPGNCVLFCRDGELLGATMLETETSSRDMGPSTLFRVVNRPVFLEGARRLVRHLGLSGFLGLDFMVDGATGAAFLIEMNPRITSPCRIRDVAGTDPISAAAASAGCSLPTAVPGTPRRLFASFPLAWQVHPHDARLAGCQDDVPWHEPALIEEALKPLWPERGPLAGLPSRWRALRQFLSTGQRPADVRSKPLSWWLAHGLLRPPSPADPPRRAQSAETAPARFESDGAAVPRPL